MAAAVAWAACAWWLLESAVPNGLELPDVDAEATFGRELVQEGERYERFLYVNWLLSQVALFATLAVYARRGVRFVRESAAGRIGTGMLLGMLGLAFAWVSQLPFGLAAHWWQRRHDLTDIGYVEWAFENWALLAGEFLFVCLALLIVMALAGPLREHWWLPGAAVFVGLGTLFAFVTPWLISTETKPLRDPALLAAAETYEHDQGVDDIDLRVEEVSDETELANAYAAGFGPSRRVVIWDTLLNDFRRDEVEVVLAHELAHHSSEHIPKGIAWYALFALPGTYILARVTRRRGGMRAPEAVPLALLVLAALQLVASPATNWISRHMEAEADWKALQSTDDPAGARGLFRGFAETSLGDPDPPAWAHILLDTHPTLADRVAMAEAYDREPPPWGREVSRLRWGRDVSRLRTGEISRPYSAQAPSTRAAISSPIASEDVAPGEGALRTCTTRSSPSKTKSSTRVPSGASACARIPACPGATSLRRSSGRSLRASRTSSVRDQSRTVSIAPTRQCRRARRRKPGAETASHRSRGRTCQRR